MDDRPPQEESPSSPVEDVLGLSIGVIRNELNQKIVRTIRLLVGLLLSCGTLVRFANVDGGTFGVV